jgi:hypothetical protein
LRVDELCLDDDVPVRVLHHPALGFRRAYLYTSGTLPAYYASLGWRAIEEVEYLGKLRTIMTFVSS